MRTFHNFSIRRKLEGIVMLTCGAALLVAAVIFTLYDRITFLRSNADDLATTTEMIGDNSTAALTFSDSDSARETLGALRAKEHIVFACIYNQSGKVLAKYSRDLALSDFTPPVPQKGGSATQNGSKVLFHSILLQGQPIGSIYIEEDLGEFSDRFARVLGIAFLVLLVSLLLAYFLSSRLQRVVSGPIRELAETALSVSTHENYSNRARKKSGDEIGFLFDQFNGMSPSSRPTTVWRGASRNAPPMSTPSSRIAPSPSSCWTRRKSFNCAIQRLNSYFSIPSRRS
jgi:two-component system, sensor histidine kinase